MLSIELKTKINEFIASTLDASQLEEWLVPNLVEWVKDPESDDADAVAAIELGLAQISSAIMDENEFRNYLKTVLQEHSRNTIRLVYNTNAPRISTAASNRMAVDVPGVILSHNLAITVSS